MRTISSQRMAALSAAISAALLVAGTGTAAAQSDGKCIGAFASAMSEPIGSARIAKPNAKVPFVRGTDHAKACPATSAACRERAFLTAGDVVLTTATRGDFVCATFVNARGQETTGWLPAKALEPVTDAGVSWVGRWRRTEADIRIKSAGNGAFAVEGNATHGSFDPKRVARGAVNLGEISGQATPSGDLLFFSDVPAASFEAAGTNGCAVRLRLIARYLLVEDNGTCGGLNVSFTGIYVKRGGTN